MPSVSKEAPLDSRVSKNHVLGKYHFGVIMYHQYKVRVEFPETGLLEQGPFPRISFWGVSWP